MLARNQRAVGLIHDSGTSQNVQNFRVVTQIKMRPADATRPRRRGDRGQEKAAAGILLRPCSECNSPAGRPSSARGGTREDPGTLIGPGSLSPDDEGVKGLGGYTTRR